MMTAPIFWQKPYLFLLLKQVIPTFAFFVPSIMETRLYYLNLTELGFEVGPRDLKAGKVFVARRDTGEKFALDFDEINETKISELFKNIEDNLRNTAQKRFEEKFFKAENFNEIDKFTGKGIIESGWCDEKSCAEEIEKTYGYNCS